MMLTMQKAPAGTSYAHPEILVDTDWVAENGQNEGVRLVEVNYDPAKFYHQGHIRGSTMLRWKDLLKGDGSMDKAFGHMWAPGMSSYDDSLAQDILNRKEFEELMSGHGIEADTKVVLYGDHDNWFAAYAFWLFKMYCHKDVCLMNGGRTKWDLEGREYASREARVRPAKYRAASIDESFRVSLDDVYDSLRDRNVRIVDVRSPAEYWGQTTTNLPLRWDEMKRKGHIPRAVNVPWRENVNEDGTFKSYDELLNLYESRGVTPDKNIVIYCLQGERSSFSWVVLKYLLGYPNVANYDGSWTEWGQATGVPIKRSVPATQGTKAANVGQGRGEAAGKKPKGLGSFWGRR